MVKRVEPVRVPRLPAGRAKFAVADLFVGPTPFAVEIGRGFRGERDEKPLAELGEHRALKERGGVGNVKKTRGIW